MSVEEYIAIDYNKKQKKASQNCEAIKVGDPDGIRTRDHLRDRQVF